MKLNNKIQIKRRRKQRQILKVKFHFIRYKLEFICIETS